MNWSLWRSFMVLIFIMLVCAASISTRLPQAVTPAPAREQPTPDPVRLHATLLRLAAADPAEMSMRQKVDALLEGHQQGSLVQTMWGYDQIDPTVLRSLSSWHSTVRRKLSSWHRLRRYDPSILGRLASMLSIPGRIPSCAVVGNSGILLRTNHGAHIDSHAAVFRLNNAGILGYGAHVGNKTNFSFIHSNILNHRCAQQPNCLCHPYGQHVPILLYICQPAHFLAITACNATLSSRHGSTISVTDARFDVLCQRIVRYYSFRRFVTETGRPPEEWDSTHQPTSFHYSSGLQAIMVAVGVCDRVSVFGFGKSSEAKHHYHDNQKTEVVRSHDYEAEYAFYHDLSMHPQEVPFLKNSGFAIPPVIFYH